MVTPMAPESAATGAAEEKSTSFSSPARILLLALWIGLTAGFLDLGLMLVKNRLIGESFYHLGIHFRWVIPAAVGAMLLLPGAALAFVACFRQRALRRHSPWGSCHSSDSWTWPRDCRWSYGHRCCCREGSPSSPSIWLVVAAGDSSGSCARTTPMLVGALVAIALWTIGGHAWWEYSASAALPPAPSNARNVLLIVWDTVRAGNLSLHGYRRPTSPNLERLAGRGVRFDRAFAAAPWTLPSHSSLFTGRWPHELTADWQSPLDATHPTLAGYLAAHGYDTAGFVANLDSAARKPDWPEDSRITRITRSEPGISSPDMSRWAAVSTG